MNNLEKQLPKSISRSTDVNEILRRINNTITDKELEVLKETDRCSDGYHNILINESGYPQCDTCLLTFDGWKTVESELAKKYYESGTKVIEERLLILKKVSSKVKRWNNTNFAITVGIFRSDPVLRGVQFISRIFYNPWDQANK